MKRNCQICGTEYDPNDHATFFFMRYCSDKCGGQAEIEARSQATGVHMYMCIKPLPIIYKGENGEKSSVVSESTKWQRDESQSEGLNEVHLINLSGLAKEPLPWLEISRQALKEHFVKI